MTCQRVIMALGSIGRHWKMPQSATDPVAKKPKLMHLEEESKAERGEDWDLQRLLTLDSAFANETTEDLALGEFEAGPANLTFLQEQTKILVIGAGGLGCEILKDLALSGFRDLHVIDMDTIDLSNLNRQFLFRQADIGQPKATVAAKFINTRIPQVTVTPYFDKIQNFDLDFYRDFHLIISGLDNIEARRWLNSVIVSLVDVEDDGQPDFSTIIPFIDGGTEGFKGQARVIIPRVTSCFECSLDTFPPQRAFPMCTIAETPRQASHCIAYAFMIIWPKTFPNKKLDTDSPDDMQWVYEKALERAEQYGIDGVTYKDTLGVVKNIIPAVASTNASISAICVNEAFKALSYCSQTMNNYHMHMGSTGVYSHTFTYDKKNDCAVCCSEDKKISVERSTLLKDFIDSLCDGSFRLQKPSITTSSANLFMQGPPVLRKATEKNLDTPLDKLLQNGEVVTITDPIFVGDMALCLQVNFNS